MMKKLLLSLVGLLVLWSLAACGAERSTDIFVSDATPAAPGAAAPIARAAPAAPAAPAVVDAGQGYWSFDFDDVGGWEMHSDVLDRMVVRNAHIHMETERFDRTIHEIERIVEIYGGFIESSSRQLWHQRDGERWHADYTLRVPVDYFDHANRDIMALASVINFSTSSEDVTMQFQDIESRLNIRREEERRILVMLENTTALDELIRLEGRLSNVRLAMERYRRRMSEIDHLASFSTIHLSLMEVESEGETIIAEDSFFTRMGAAFGGSVEFTLTLLEGAAMLVAVLVLPLGLLALPVLAVVYFVRKTLKNADSNM